jgi:hypothetical protein
MPEKCETPHGGGVSRNSCGGCFRDSLTPHNLQVQFLIAAHHVRPEFAAMIAALAFGGSGTHG